MKHSCALAITMAAATMTMTTRVFSSPLASAFLLLPRSRSHICVRGGSLCHQHNRGRAFCKISTYQSGLHGSDDQDYGHDDDARSSAKEAINILARRGKSWKRLKSLVDLAVVATQIADSESSASLRDEEQIIRRGGIADIGTDHGLLAVGLAMTGRFKKVVGVDVSENALRDGAFKLHQEISTYLEQRQGQEVASTEELNRLQQNAPLPIEFRCGDGLKPLQVSDEINALCIAGMGTNTMMDVLSVTTDDTEDSQQVLLVDKLDCQHIVAQPTSSRPRLLMHLYDGLSNRGWEAKAERMECISSRWYLSTLFSRVKGGANNLMAGRAYLPGEKLLSLEPSQTTTAQQEAFRQWITHHVTWIDQDVQIAGEIGEEDARWLKVFGKDNKPR